MSNKYQKFIEILPTQTSSYIETATSQDNVVFSDINYFANLWESEILIKSMTLTSAIAWDSANIKMLILSKLGLFQKFQHKELGQVIYEQVYQQEKNRLDADVYWDCIQDRGGNVFHTRVQDKSVNANLGFSAGKGIQFQVVDVASTAALVNQQCLLQKGQMANYFVAPCVNGATTIVLENIRIPLKYMLYNTLYQTKQMDGYLPLKNSELTFQFAQFDTFIKKNITADEGTVANLQAIVTSGLSSVTYQNISLVLNTVNYIPLEKPIQFSYYHSLVEKQTIQTKQNELDFAQDKSLIQLFFQYYPTQLLAANTINPGFVAQNGDSQIIINELHYGSDKILPRLTGNDQLLKMYVQNQLRLINPKLDIDQFFKQSNIIPLILDVFDGVGEMNPQKVRVRYETANTNYALLMYQVTSRIVQISQDGLELIA